MIDMVRHGFSMRQYAEFVRWHHGVDGWEAETVGGIPARWTDTGLLVRVDGELQELHRDEWSYCDSST